MTYISTAISTRMMIIRLRAKSETVSSGQCRIWSCGRVGNGGFGRGFSTEQGAHSFRYFSLKSKRYCEGAARWFNLQYGWKTVFPKKEYKPEDNDNDQRQ